MRALVAPTVVTVGLLVTLGLMGSLAHGSESLAREKVKTGILPSGGFYQIYQVACSDQKSTSLASLDGGRRWCTSDDGNLSCFSRVQEAHDRACSTLKLAST